MSLRSSFVEGFKEGFWIGWKKGIFFGFTIVSMVILLMFFGVFK